MGGGRAKDKGRDSERLDENRGGGGGGGKLTAAFNNARRAVRRSKNPIDPVIPVML